MRDTCRLNTDMFSQTDITAKAWMVREVVNLVLQKSNLQVDKMYLVGSYARNEQTEYSDLDILVQLRGGKLYPSWQQIQEIHKNLSNRIHVIFGSGEAQQSMFKRVGKLYQYRELQLPKGGNDNVTHSTSVT